MPKVNNFSAWITVNGQVLEEYDVQVGKDAKTVNCWIPSEVGKMYVVRWRDHYFQSPTCGIVHVDGHFCGGSSVSMPNVDMFHEGIYTDSTTLKPFTFSPVRASDDHSLLSASAGSDLGLISLEIFNVQLIEASSPWGEATVPTSRTYHEKTTKGIDHQTSFQQSVTVPQFSCREAEFVGEPIAIFHFRYRPLPILQAQGIAPRPSTAQYESASRTPYSEPHGRVKVELHSDGEFVEEMETEDAQQLAELQRQMDAIRAKHKAKVRTRKIKTEPIVGLKIDLTEED
ncbi:hypothetical protein L218DRAFT_963004 [Marasmius fiardii PR-910]|nr:hypothetical protein L218DRAFT_963004 [Marasmius fiardii PR-910]